MTNLDSIFKSRDITLSTKVRLVKAMAFPMGSYLFMSNFTCLLFTKTVVLEKTLESPLDCKEIQPVHSQRDQPWDFFGGKDADAATPVLWPPHAKS